MRLMAPRLGSVVAHPNAQMPGQGREETACGAKSRTAPVPPLAGLEQIIARVVEAYRLLRVDAVDDLVEQGQGSSADDPSVRILFQDRVVNGDGVPENIAAQDFTT